jgi:hypothetical protein
LLEEIFAPAYLHWCLTFRLAMGQTDLIDPDARQPTINTRFKDLLRGLPIHMSGQKQPVRQLSV